LFCRCALCLFQRITVDGVLFYFFFMFVDLLCHWSTRVAVPAKDVAVNFTGLSLAHCPSKWIPSWASIPLLAHRLAPSKGECFPSSYGSVLRFPPALGKQTNKQKKNSDGCSSGYLFQCGMPGYALQVQLHGAHTEML
jgi:hypothetical protein